MVAAGKLCCLSDNSGWKNAFSNPQVGTPIYNQGKIVEEEFERLVYKYLPCYVDSLTEERKTDTPLSDSSESGSEKKIKKKKYEDDPDVDPSTLNTS